MAAASRELLIRDCQRLGVSIEIDPAEALLQQVYEAAGNVQFYRQLVDQLPTHPEDDELSIDGEGDSHWKRGAPGVYGRTYHVSGIPTGEAKPHILVTLYNDERQRLVAFAKAALDNGVAERRVQLAERDATAIAQAQIAALVAMGLADRLEQFREHFHANFRALPSGAAEGD